MNTFGIELTSKYDGFSDNMFRWTIIVSRGERCYSTNYSCGSAHCSRVDTRPSKAPFEPNSAEFARNLNPYGRLTISDCEGYVVPHAPRLKDVLYSLQSDASSGEHLLFEDFASEFGYDIDSRKAEKTWRACQEVRGQLQRLLGSDFDEFMGYDFDSESDSGVAST